MTRKTRRRAKQKERRAERGHKVKLKEVWLWEEETDVYLRATMEAQEVRSMKQKKRERNSILPRGKTHQLANGTKWTRGVSEETPTASELSQRMKRAQLWSRLLLPLAKLNEPRPKEIHIVNGEEINIPPPENKASGTKEPVLRLSSGHEEDSREDGTSGAIEKR